MTPEARSEAELAAVAASRLPEPAPPALPRVKVWETKVVQLSCSPFPDATGRHALERCITLNPDHNYDGLFLEEWPVGTKVRVTIEEIRPLAPLEASPVAGGTVRVLRHLLLLFLLRMPISKADRLSTWTLLTGESWPPLP